MVYLRLKVPFCANFLKLFDFVSPNDFFNNVILFIDFLSFLCLLLFFISVAQLFGIKNF